ncbi:MAG: hypothetical protein MZU97_01465 [Bacillus subtilis]|nr:hypothetical protein [Bacillus subtilis]
MMLSKSADVVRDIPLFKQIQTAFAAGRHDDDHDRQRDACRRSSNPPSRRPPNASARSPS